MGRIAMLVIGALLFLAGILWMLQGLDLVGSSGMSGHKVWAVIGLIVAIIGAFVFIRNRRTPPVNKGL